MWAAGAATSRYRPTSSAPTAYEVATHGDADRLAERAGHDAEAIGLLALVEDDDADGSRRLRVLDLLPERARPALDERDRAGREIGEVGRLTTGGRSARRAVADGHHDVDGDDAPVTSPDAGEVHRDELVRVCEHPGRGRGQLERRRRELLEERELERLLLDLPARRAHGGGDVVGGLVVARRAGHPGPAVLVGELLELVLVLQDVGHRDRLAVRRRVEAVGRLRAGWNQHGKRRHGEQNSSHRFPLSSPVLRANAGKGSLPRPKCLACT